MAHLDDDTIRLLARAIHAARGHGREPRFVFEALSNTEQLALELEAVVIIREGDPLAQRVALHRAAASIGVPVGLMAEGLMTYSLQLSGA